MAGVLELHSRLRSGQHWEEADAQDLAKEPSVHDILERIGVLDQDTGEAMLDMPCLSHSKSSSVGDDATCSAYESEPYWSFQYGPEHVKPQFRIDEVQSPIFGRTPSPLVLPSDDSFGLQGSQCFWDGSGMVDSHCTDTVSTGDGQNQNFLPRYFSCQP
jgi:hypothetical protein